MNKHEVKENSQEATRITSEVKATERGAGGFEERARHSQEGM